MNQISRLILCLFITGISCGNIFSQRIEITKEVFYQRYEPMIEKTEKQTRRINNQNERTFPGTEGKSTSTQTVEIIPPDKIYFNYTVPGSWVNKSGFPDSYGNRSETIFIGNTMYHKQIESRGEKSKNFWEMKEVEKPNSLLVFKPPLNREGVKWYLTENVQVNGQMTDLFECILRKDFRAINRKTKELDDFVLNGEWKYWISKDNLLIKSEHYQGDTNYLPQTLRLTYEYEYDPSIKIEAPIK